MCKDRQRHKDNDHQPTHDRQGCLHCKSRKGKREGEGGRTKERGGDDRRGGEGRGEERKGRGEELGGGKRRREKRSVKERRGDGRGQLTV